MRKDDQTTTEGVAHVPDAALLNKSCITEPWHSDQSAEEGVKYWEQRRWGKKGEAVWTKLQLATLLSKSPLRKREKSNIPTHHEGRVPKHLWTVVNLRLCLFHSADTVSKTSGFGGCVVLDCLGFSKGGCHSFCSISQQRIEHQFFNLCNCLAYITVEMKPNSFTYRWFQTDVFSINV